MANPSYRLRATPIGAGVAARLRLVLVLVAFASALSCEAKHCEVTTAACGSSYFGEEPFAPPDTVTISVDPPEGGATSVKGGVYADSAKVIVTATPNASYTFLNWTSGASIVGTSPALTIDRSPKLGLVAHFQSTIQYGVTIVGAGVGTGTVTADTTLNCTVTVGVASGSCTGRYHTSSTIVLKAVPAPGNVLANWTGPCSSLLAADTTRVPKGACALASIPAGMPSADQTITATFAAADYAITARVRAGDSGSVVGGNFPAGATASVVATPAAGWAFLYWTNVPGGIATGDSIYRFTATTTRAFEAAFTNSPVRYAITTTANPTIGGTVTGAGVVASGRYIAVVAAPAAGYRFADWTDSTGAVIGTSPTYPGFLASANRSFTANFLPSNGTLTLTVAAGGSGNGQVVATPAGINCSSAGGATSGTCTANYAAGTVVSLAATPTTGSVFTGWTGACAGVSACTATMTDNRSVTAAFLPASAPLDLTIDGAYLTQSVQNYAGTVPLVAGRDALLRVFVKASGTNGGAPSVRARLFANGVNFATDIIPAPSAGVPTSIDEGNFTSSWNLVVPANEIRPGLSILLDVDPDGVIAESNRANNSYPGNGSPLPLDVRTRQSFDVTFVPVGRQGVTRTPGDVKTGNIDLYLNRALSLWPIGPSTATVHAPYFFFGEPQQRCTDPTLPCILTDLAAVRAVEGSNSYYYGVFTVNSATTADFDGTAVTGGTIAAGSELGGGLTAAHEWGHNFGRGDAPCGTQPGTDPAYPYLGGAAGVFGYDTQTGTSHPPGTLAAQPSGSALSYDIMSACTPNWVSDYNYTGAFASLNTSPAVGAAAPGILIWGRVTPTGAVVLEPAFTVTAPSIVPTGPGTMELRALDASGQSLFDFPFDPTAEAHAGGGDFCFVIPLNAARPSPSAIQILRNGVLVAERHAVSSWLGDAGSATPASFKLIRSPGGLLLSWDTGAGPAVMMRDALTGAVLSIARGGSLLMYYPATSQVELSISDGVRSFAQIVDVPP